MEEEERQRLSQPDNQHHHAFDRGVRFAGVEPTTAGSSVAEYAPDEESRNLSKRSVWIAEATQSSADKAKQASLRIHEARNKTKIKVGLKMFSIFLSNNQTNNIILVEKQFLSFLCCSITMSYYITFANLKYS